MQLNEVLESGAGNYIFLEWFKTSFNYRMQ
jgi:hypothetical protein